MRIGIATCRPLPEPDPDETLLLEALRREGAEARLLVWDDPEADPGGYDLCVVRSTWNYHLDPGGFAGWIERAAGATRLENPAVAMRWNLHKGYLRELEGNGVPVVPTAWVGRGQGGTRVDLRALMAERGWGDVVVKPAVSAASHGTVRVGEANMEAGQRWLEGLVAEGGDAGAGAGEAMVQPYLSSVETEAGAERAIVWIDGAVTHVIRKRARFAGEDESVSEGFEPTGEERAFAERTLGALGGPAEGLLYARVDVMRDEGGRMVLSELELIEPSLFLKQSPGALARLVGGIVGRGRGR